MQCAYVNFLMNIIMQEKNRRIYIYAHGVDQLNVIYANLHVFARDTQQIVNISRITKRAILKKTGLLTRPYTYNITTLDFTKVTANVNVGTVYVQDSLLQ
jgi:hypothetical protein